MAKTPVALYRRGNSQSPRMDNVRLDKDIAAYEQNEIIWVRETIGDLDRTWRDFCLFGSGKR